VLAKEVAPFNVRLLTVNLGTFDTNMVNAIQRSETPLDPDYKDSMADKIMQALTTENYVPDGDHKKAVKAMYEVIVSEGIGEGREAERFLPLGRDVAARIRHVVDQWNHTLDVFGPVTNNVFRDTK
jgi:NAD(P)-dependent dehydrogenase (short-subunit alcohol dehydrogenase family)